MKTMVMKHWEKNNQIEDSIRGLLDEREESYIPGAWEAFVHHRDRRRKKRYLKFVTTAAAFFLILFVGFHFLFSPDSHSPHSTIERAMDGEQRPVVKSPMVEQPVIKQLAVLSPPTQPMTLLEPETKRPPTERVDTTQQTVIPKKDQKPLTEKKQTSTDKSSDPWLVKNNEEHRTTRERIRLGIHFSPGIVTTSSATSFAIAGGITADIPISGSFSLSTGILTEHQHISMTQASRESMGIDYRTSGDLTAIDVPLNLTWKFHSVKNRSFYISGGVSSILFIQQEYQMIDRKQELVELVKEHNGKQEIVYEVITKESVTAESSPPFDNFHPFGRINLTLGMEQRLTGRFYYHVEPYVKIPITELGTKDMRFMGAGINFKVSF